MKKLLPLLPLLLLIISCSKAIDGKSLVGRNGVFYQVNSETPYSGKSFGLYENGRGSEYNGWYDNWRSEGVYSSVKILLR